MFAFSLIPFASLAISSVSGLVVPRKSPPPGWAYGYLEEYDVYHTRYLAIGCHEKHNTEFFDQCCHPMLATENLQDNRAPWCTPSASASASASAAEPTSTVDPEEDDAYECDDSDDYDDEEEEDDEEEYDCDDEDDSDSSSEIPAPTTSASPIPTPEPTTSETPQPTPEPTSSDEPSSTTSSETPEETGSDDNNSGSDVHTGGFATFYYQNGNAGACGEKHGDDELIAAIDAAQYGDLGQKSDLCGRQVEITNAANHKTVTVTIKDVCPTCRNSESIDLSYAAFTSIATESEGIVEIEWRFV